MSMGTVTGPYTDEFLVCQSIHKICPKSLWHDIHIFDYALPVLLVQTILIFFVSRFIHFVLRPVQQSMMMAQLLAGIIIGPTILGRYVTFMRYLFPPEGRVTLQIFANLGFMLHFFILGVQLNANLLKKVGTNAALIGSLAFAMPYVIGGLSYLTMRSLMPMDQTLRTGLVVVVTANSLSSFPVIISLLSELNILNSELGRLAIYTSMVSDLCCVCMATTLTTVGALREHSKWNSLSSMFWMVFFVFVVLFVLRPFILWLTKKTPEGQQLEEFHFFVILVLVFGCAFCSQYLGRQPAFGPLLLGIVLPEGPPIATTVVKKLDTITNGLFIPVFFAISGLTTDLMAFRGRRALAITELVIIMGYVGKFVGTLLPALYFGVPFWDATSLALIMCCKGIIDVAVYNAWRDGKNYGRSSLRSIEEVHSLREKDHSQL